MYLILSLKKIFYISYMLVKSLKKCLGYGRRTVWGHNSVVQPQLRRQGHGRQDLSGQVCLQDQSEEYDQGHISANHRGFWLHLAGSLQSRTFCINYALFINYLTWYSPIRYQKQVSHRNITSVRLQMLTSWR